MRQKIVAGNWKMNKSSVEANALILELVQLVKTEVTEKTTVIICPPFPYLASAKYLTKGSSIHVGAQNCSEHEWGAYTGEVSAPMLMSLGVNYVIIGHSERRQYYHEEAKLLAVKVDRALAHGLTPIFCCGEPLAIRELGTHEKLVCQQLEESLFHLNTEQMQKVVIAYEPVWAIGTGKTATSQQAQDMHAVIRRHLASHFGAVAQEVSILYGGSVKAENAKEIFSQPDVDGGLVGGASLKSGEFVEIIKGS